MPTPMETNIIHPHMTNFAVNGPVDIDGVGENLSSFIKDERGGILLLKGDDDTEVIGFSLKRSFRESG